VTWNFLKHTLGEGEMKMAKEKAQQGFRTSLPEYKGTSIYITPKELQKAKTKFYKKMGMKMGKAKVRHNRTSTKGKTFPAGKGGVKKTIVMIYKAKGLPSRVSAELLRLGYDKRLFTEKDLKKLTDYWTKTKNIRGLQSEIVKTQHKKNTKFFEENTRILQEIKRERGR